MVADALREEGFTAEVEPARRARHGERYEAVVVGGALYASRWCRDARRFVKRNARELRGCPTYLFSSGPLDDSAIPGDIPRLKGVQALIGKIGARGHVTFGGRMVPDAKGFPASAIAKKRAGDWRDPKQVRSWAHDVAAHFGTSRSGLGPGFVA
jgi:menaquinone-dependent protoporphyrinogen oxidase